MIDEAQRARIPQDELHDRIRTGLSSLVSSSPQPRRSALENQLAPHRELIGQAISKGHTYRTVATTLTEAGLKVSPEAIRRFFQRMSGSTKSKRRRGAKPQG